jgi:integrase
MNGMFSDLFKKLGVSIKSHDFRHTKITDLGEHLTPQHVRDYVGHSSISVTDVYLHTK